MVKKCLYRIGRLSPSYLKGMYRALVLTFPMNMKNSSLLVVLLQALAITCVVQSKVDDLILSDKIPELSEKQILKTPGYYHWGASICKNENGLYHLFYSRWKITHSKIAHATSNHPAGPWEYKQTALQGRGKGHWDAITTHNHQKYQDESRYGVAARQAGKAIHLYGKRENLGFKPVKI